MRNFLVVSMILAALLAGCAGGGDAAPSAGTTVQSVRPSAGMLPAWPGPGDRHVAGKADQYSDYRAQNPDYYAITVPPASTFRSFMEWEDMQAVLLSYTGGLGSAITASMAGMVVHGADVVDWWVLVPDAARKTEFVNAMKAQGLPQATIDAKVHFLTFAADSMWMIDFGPFPLVKGDGTVAFTDFRYYHERVMDDAVPTMLGKLWGPTTYRAPMSLEGGNFNADGTGTCYTTQGAFDENPGMTEAQVKDVFRQYLGCTQMITLIPLEDGTSHIDMFSKLTGPNTFLLGKGSSARNSAKTIADLDSDVGILQAVVRTDGSKLTVHRIPMPYQKDNVWRTYTNSTLVNGVNLVPVYPSDAALEAEALNAWKTAMPSWNHVGIDSDEIITWGGAMHCISRTVPAGTYAKWEADGVCNRGTCQGGAGAAAGTCQADTDCTGPEWVCALNDCNGATGCGDLTDVGCCDGNVVRYCDAGSAAALDCSGTAGCGWNTQGYYDCGTTTSDPSGTYPKACGGTCTPSCAGKACGSDGCSGTCGTCSAGTSCVSGQCKAGGSTYPDACLGDATPSAATCPDGLTFEGCCDGKGRTIWCDGGALYCLDCPAEPAPGNTCGWATTDSQGNPANFYACGGEGADPSGANPLSCEGTVCVPACNGKECGADGCGGLCGTCPGDQECNVGGQCVSVTPEPRPDAVDDPGPATDVPATDLPPADVPAIDTPAADGCVPQCAGGRCGDDGCGGRCPACGEGYVCNEASWCVRDSDPRPDAVSPDTAGTDTGIVPLPVKGGGCAAGAGPAGGTGAVWFWFGIVAFLAIRLVYTTARE